MKAVAWIVYLVVMAGYSASAFSQEGVGVDIGSTEESSSFKNCQSAQVFERIFTDVCWSCYLPMRISGVDIGGSSPRGAYSSPLCICDGDAALPGIASGGWEPVDLFEVVQNPGCSPTLGGTELPLGSNREIGSLGGGSDRGSSSSSTFRHVHQFTFPIGEVMGLVRGCNPGPGDIDLAIVTELVPTWSDDVLNSVVNPESIALALPPVILTCMAEAATTGITGREPIEQLFWCAGSWGSLYPMGGTLSYGSSPPEDTSLIAARFLNQIHRWGFARKTLGDACGGSIYPMVPKSQYKMQQFWPRPESNNNHWIGESDIRWGSHRNRPGHDYLHLLWQWRDCCLEIF